MPQNGPIFFKYKNLLQLLTLNTNYISMLTPLQEYRLRNNSDTQNTILVQLKYLINKHLNKSRLHLFHLPYPIPSSHISV